ncbi:MAG: macro domain-containing protein, partial [Actinobacteria bacterium]|nr:macro domain-containing protein [Actinomycetota bacterium]
MIEYVEGDLLKADADALVNTVNTVGVMGKGVALQFKQAFPFNFKVYRAACKRGEVRVGKMFVFDAGQITKPRYIINFPTKTHWKARSRLADVESGLRDLRRVVKELNVTSIAVPPLGCGNGGLDWRDVRPLITDALGDLEGVYVLVFEPKGAPRASQMKVGTAKPKMTRGRAVLIGLLDRYLGLADLGASPIEVQKLVYFAQRAGEPLRLNFETGRYGPYAEALGHVLEAMEGHYVRGYGDRSKKVPEAEPITLMGGAADEARVWLSAHPESVDRIGRVLELTDGFQSAYEMELLATVDWV